MTQEQPQRPAAVGSALKLIYATLVLGFVRDFWEVARLSESIPLGRLIFVQAFVFAFILFFTWKIGKGRNWARLTFAIMFLAGLPLAVTPLWQSLMAAPVSGILGLVQVLMQLAAVVFLYQKASSEWFRQMKVMKRTVLPVQT